VHLDQNEIKYPFILVNIKSGISFYRIENESVFEKIGGSFLGDNTFESLMKLSTDY